MQCFAHATVAAVGICRACGKGICRDCAREGAHGIVCSDPCQDFVDTQYEMVERAKRVYGMGSARQRFPGPAIIFILFGLFMIAVALVTGWNAPLDGLVPGGMGLIFLLGAAIIWRRLRYTGLNL